MRAIQLSFLILVSTGLAAQCEIPLPADAIPVHASDTTISPSEEFFWICEGITATFTGENSVILGEAASFLHIFGDNNTVITKGGVMLHGMNTNVYALDEELVDDMGTNSNVAICSEIAFQLDQAPQGGCMTTSIGESSGPQDAIRVYPNPMIDLLNIEAIDGRSMEVRLIDAMGREMKQVADPEHGVDVGDLPVGAYTVLIATNTGIFSRTVIKADRSVGHIN